MTRPVLTHLIDDTTPGGVMRVLDHIQSAPEVARLGCHRVIALPRSGRLPARFQTDILVSHLTINWRRLPWLIGLRAAHADVPMVHVEHSYTEAFAARNVRRPVRFRTLLTTSFSLFERVVAVSEAQGAWLRGRSLVAAECLKVVPSAVDLEPYLALPMIMGPVRVVGALGRLEPQKGFDVLIEAFRDIRDPGLKLHLYGEGSERARLEALAAGDPRVRFMGHEDPVAAMAAVDAVAMPSRWEAYGLVALEARAAGRPLLVAPVDGLRDHAAEGAVAVEGGVAGWSRALQRLAEHFDPSPLALARGAAATAPTQFAAGWAEVLEKFNGQAEIRHAA